LMSKCEYVMSETVMWWFVFFLKKEIRLQ